MFYRKFLLLLVVIALIPVSCVSFQKAAAFVRVSTKMNNRTYSFYKQETIPYGTDQRQYVNVYYPETRTQEEIIWYTHGGGWYMWSPEDFEFAADFFTSLGYITVMPSYRLVPEVHAPQILDDLFTGFKMANEAIEEFQSRPAQYILAGSSAGAHLSANLAFNQGLHKRYGILSNTLNGYISFAGVLNFQECKNQRIEKLINDFLNSDPENWRENSDPIKQLTDYSDIPVFIIHSDKDETVEAANGYSFKERAKELGMDVEMAVQAELSHDDSYFLPLFTPLIGESEDSAEAIALKNWLARISTPVIE